MKSNKILLICVAVIMMLLVACNTSAVLGPKEVTDAFLSELFKVEDYKVVNATNDDDILMMAIIEIAPLEPYTTTTVLKNMIANRTRYTIEAEAEHFKGVGKWVSTESEVRDQTKESCTVWYTGEFVIAVEGGTDIKYPISGTAFLKKDETGWVIQGNRLISFPLGEWVQ